MIPIFINCRDRVTPLRELVSWLERAGQERIVLLDNASTYEPLLEYYRGLPHEVIFLGANVGSRALWKAQRVPQEWFVYTDPDVIPTEDCPLDAVEYLHDLLQNSPGFFKAGLGLYLDDLPQDFKYREWERSLVSEGREIAPGVYDSEIDTTFAMHRPGARFDLRALRTGYPYQARHVSWYVSEPEAEDRFYLDRAVAGPNGSSWKGWA